MSKFSVVNSIDLLSIFLIFLISAGVVLRVILSLLAIMNGEDSDTHKKRIKNAIYFYIVSIMIFKIKDIILSYF